MTHGWRPEGGFLPYRWEGYDEALLLYVLGLGSPTHPLPAESYQAWASTYQWKTVYEYAIPVRGTALHASALPRVDRLSRHPGRVHARPRDRLLREQPARHRWCSSSTPSAIPAAIARYGEFCWGITASDGPGEITRVVDGVERRFFDYRARGVPDGPDDGTIAPWAVVASLPFAPEIVLPTIAHFIRLHLSDVHPYGFKATFNPTFPDRSGSPLGWVSPWHFGLNQGPIVVMIENHRLGTGVAVDTRLSTHRRGAAGRRIHRRVAVSHGSAGRARVRSRRRVLFSDGRYTEMIAAAGLGYSAGGTSPSRGGVRTRPATTPVRTSFSATSRAARAGRRVFQPSGAAPESYDVSFAEARAEVLRRDGAIATRLEVIVSFGTRVAP